MERTWETVGGTPVTVLRGCGVKICAQPPNRLIHTISSRLELLLSTTIKNSYNSSRDFTMFGGGGVNPYDEIVSEYCILVTFLSVWNVYDVGRCSEDYR